MDFADRVRESFARQTIMATIGARLGPISEGSVEIVLPFRPDLCQQDGFIHAGIVTTIVDSACGYAAYSLMPPEVGVLTVEFKTNFVRPAIGECMIARARVERAGRTISVCRGEVVAVVAGEEKSVALMQATIMAIMSQ